MYFNKTIVFLVTAPITQNIALIRISGPKTYPIITKIFDRPLSNYPQPRPQLIFGKIINPQQETIDEVLLLCFYKPHSFTGEDVVEISCHGNLFIVNQIIKLILENGAELATEGEFTKQAFFNDKLNLTQASAVNDLIRAPSLTGTKLALHNLSPKTQRRLQRELEPIENELLEIIANVKVNIDYPEYDGVEYLTGQKVLPRLIRIIKKLKIIQKIGQKFRVYQEGLKVAIIGKPNVGKSTLLNALLQEKKAIVSPVAGTTRDVVEARYNLEGIPVNLLDTAGIHETPDKVERIGIKRSYRALAKADIIFFCVDNSSLWSSVEEKIYQKIKNKNYLLIVNKIDKVNKLKIPVTVPVKKICRISAKKQQLTEIETKISRLFSGDLISNLPSYSVLSQSWQQTKLAQLIQQLEAIKKETYLDAVSGDLEMSYKLVKELSGKDYNDDLLDIIFSKFCLGK